MRKFVVLLSVLLVLAEVGCGSKAPPASPPKEPPLTVAEWEKIEDPEQKFNRATMSRLPRGMAAKMMQKYKK